MGKPTGFMEYERREAGSVEPKERIKNFNEFHVFLSKENQQKQASRCMDCGVPFCQAGATIAGMTSGCPLHNLVPEWNDLVYTGNWEISIVPTASDLSDALNTTDKVSIGLWKTTAGVIKNSTTGSSSASNTSGNCWGNGTAYPVLGYSVVTTSGTAIETAQMK